MATIVKNRQRAGTAGSGTVRRYTVRYADSAHTPRCKPGCTMTSHQRERSFKRETDAKDFLAKYEHDSRTVLGFSDPAAASETFGAAAQRFIDTCRPATREAYQVCLNAHLGALARRPLRDVANDRDGVEAMTVGHPGGKRMLAVIRCTCQRAVNAGTLDSHRLAGLKANAAGGVRELILHTRAQADIMAAELGRDGLAIYLMRSAGLRAGEVLALESTDFNGSVRVWRQIQAGAMVPLKSKKQLGAGAKVIPLAPYLQAMVAAHVKRYGTGRLFTTSYDPFLNRFHKAAKAAGLPAEFSPHQLRHHFATNLLHAGVSLDLVAKLMGHADTRETSRVYAHWRAGDDDAVRAVMEADKDMVE